MKYSYLMNKSAFINAETLRILDSAHTYAPQGIGGHALQRRDSGRLYLRFFIVVNYWWFILWYDPRPTNTRSYIYQIVSTSFLRNFLREMLFRDFE
jgi:hypothetical protein